MTRCPFCYENKELLNLASPYISFGKEINFSICSECKEILDFQGHIRDPKGIYGFLV